LDSSVYERPASALPIQSASTCPSVDFVTALQPDAATRRDSGFIDQRNPRWDRDALTRQWRGSALLFNRMVPYQVQLAS